MTRILLVDDHPLLRHGVRSMLETQSDFAVVAEAGSRDEAVAIAEAHEIDVALIDIDLGPGLPTGIDTTGAVLRAQPTTRVLIFTAYDSDADIVRAAEAGASGYLVKDSHPSQLFRAIRSAARGDTTLASSVEARLAERGENPHGALTPRELDVLALAAAGLSTRELARKLFVSEATVKTHLHHAYLKLDADNRQAAIAVAIKRGLIRI